MTRDARQAAQAARDYARIEAAIGFLQTHFRDQPGLDDIAASVNVSPYHFQRLFVRWAGVSPKQFLRCLTLEHARRALADSADVLGAALDAGLSGPGRLHDLFVTLEGISPGEYKALGGGLEIRWGRHAGPFGDFVVAMTGRGICALEFTGPDGPEDALARLRGRLPGARFCRDDAGTAPLAGRLFASEPGPLHLWVRGTSFQVRVWRALLELRPGQLASYGTLACRLGQPGAARAVGNAVAANPVAWLIPCHRVIRGTSLFDTGYRWGPARKLAMIGAEAARAAPQSCGRPSTSNMV